MGVGVDPLVLAHHLVPSLLPSLRGNERAPRGKIPNHKLSPTDFTPSDVLTGGCACERGALRDRGTAAPPRLPRSYNLSGAEAKD